MSDDNRQETEAASEAAKRTRDTGKLLWQQAVSFPASDLPSDERRVECWIDTGPHHEDLVAAKKWLTAELTASRLPQGMYRPCRVNAEVCAKIKTTVQVSLDLAEVG